MKWTFVHQLAAVGNAAALLLLALMLMNADVWIDDRPGTSSPPSSPMRKSVDRVVLVVVDALRNDVANDAATMPRLNQLARRGRRGTLLVESLIPSTMAGVAALSSGRVAAPASFLQDFRALPSADGGMFAAVAEVGSRSFVAGPLIWTDRYQRWLAGSRALSDDGDHDESALQGAINALKSRDFQLIVVHFARTDAAAHEFGGASNRYREAAAWCDTAVGRLADQLTARDMLFVTADHGATEQGGHAGREPEVVNTPLIVVGPDATNTNLQLTLQRDVAASICNLLGASLPADERSERALPLWTLITASSVALMSAASIWSAIQRGASGWPQAFFLNLSFWLALGMVLLDWHGAAAIVAIGSLVLHAIWMRDAPQWTILASISLGVAVAAMKLLIEHHHPLMFDAPSRPSSHGVRTFLVAVVAILVGVLLRCGMKRISSPSAAGTALALALSPLLYASGQSLSLSSLAVMPAYGLTHFQGGLVLAIVVVALIHALPTFGLTIGFFFSRKEPAFDRWASLAVHAVAYLCGGAAGAAAVARLRPLQLDLASLATASFVRDMANVLFLLAALLATTILKRPRVAPVP